MLQTIFNYSGKALLTEVAVSPVTVNANTTTGRNASLYISVDGSAYRRIANNDYLYAANQDLALNQPESIGGCLIKSASSLILKSEQRDGQKIQVRYSVL